MIFSPLHRKIACIFMAKPEHSHEFDDKSKLIVDHNYGRIWVCKFLFYVSKQNIH